jgi:hypothetical protein
MDAGDYHSWSPIETDALSLLDSTDKLNWFTRGIAKNLYSSEKEKLGTTPTQKQVDALNIPGNIDWLQGKDYITDKQASRFGNQFNSIYNQNFNPTASYSSAPTPSPTPSTSPFSNIDTDYETGVEDPYEETTSIGATKPAPSFTANNYNTPSLLGNVQAAEEYAPAPTSKPDNSLLDNSLKTLAGATAAQAADMARHAITGKGQSILPNSVAKAQGIAKPSLKSWWTAGKTPFGLKGSFLGAHPTKGGVAGLVAAAGYGGYKLGDWAIDTELADKYGFGRQDLRGYGASMYNPNRLNEDKRDYRLGQRQKAQTAREAVAKAQAVADAKAKVEAEQARQTEKEKQRMVDNKSFSDTDSGSFDEGGNYSDWGSKEEYDDDFGADSTWGDDGGDSGGSSGGGGGGGSYIATATTQALGEEGLTVFNNWRDHMRNVVPEFTVSFGRYRVTAPKIVTAIDKKDNSKAIYKDIWDKHLKPIYDLIVADKDSVKAQDDYRVMVRELSNKHLKDK